MGVLLGISPGCRFDPSGVDPTQYVGNCTATVRGEDGEGTEFAITSFDEELRPQIPVTWCATGPGTDEERIRRQWEGYLADALSGDFRGTPGPWCVVEGSVSCTLGDPQDETEPCPAPPSGATLGFCPSPPGPECVQVDPLLDFGTVDVGVSSALPLEISNTCTHTIGVRVGESILGAEADEFEVTDNRCPPLPGDSARFLAPAGDPGDRCDLDVTFLPVSPLTRSAEYRFLEEPATTVAVQLRGEGRGATASVAPDHSLCLDGPLAGPQQCTVDTGEWLVTNLGPGGIRVVDGVLDPLAGTGFRLTVPPVGSFIARNATATLTVEWCQALSSAITEAASYQLTLTTDTAANHTFDLKMETPPCS